MSHETRDLSTPVDRRKNRHGNLPAYAAGATLAMLLAMTIGTAVAIHSIMASQSESKFEEFAAGLKITIDADIQRAFGELDAVESFVVGSADVTAETFDAFVSKFTAAGSDSQSLGYAPLVTRFELDEFNDLMRSSGRQDYDLSNTGYRPEYIPLAYSYPVIPGLVSPGTDFLSDSRYRDTVLEARRSRQVVASEPRVGAGGGVSIVVFQPVEALAPESANPLNGPLIGMVVAAYQVNEFIAASPAWSRLDGIAYRLVDRTGGAFGSQIYPDPGADSRSELSGGRSASVSVDFAGRTWELQMVAPPDYGLSPLERATWLIVLVAGLALTLFATVSTYSLLKSRQAVNTDLRLVSSQFRLILDSALEGILLADEDGRVAWANQAFADAFGYGEPSSLLGADLIELLGRQSVELEAKDAYLSRVRLLCSRMEMTVASEDVVIKRPHRRILSMTSAPVVDDRSGYLGRLWVYRDVTNERDSDRAKIEFISMVSHELRTPLTALTGFVELALDGAGGELQPEGKRLLGIASANGHRLTRLVSDLLDISRLEAGRFELRPEFIFLGDLLRNVATSLEADFAAKKISFGLFVEPGLPRVWADPERTAQVASNLLTNACRYTANGGSVSVEARHDSGKVVFTVSDTGMGIAREDQGRVFDKFVRLQGRNGSPKGSTGLGLAITKSLVELQGGSIRVESEQGKGSSFIVTLPTMPPENRAAAA